MTTIRGGTSTQQEGRKRKGNPNPSPDTRFGAKNGNPQSPGGWKKENTISYQYNRFLNMTPEELEAYSKVPKKDRTVAMDIAYQRVLASRKSLADVKEITDRTEGKAPQSVDLTSDGKPIQAPIIVSEVIARHVDPEGETAPSNREA